MLVRLAILALVLLPAGVSAEAALFLAPSQMTPEMGKPFEVEIYADAGGHEVNAAEATLNYDPTLVRIRSISKIGSLASSWPSEPTDTDGVLSFSSWFGVRYSGAQGLLLRITFEPLRVGQGTIEITSGTLLAADVQETNVIASMRSASFTVAPARVIPPAPELPTVPVATTTAEQPLVPEVVVPEPAATTTVSGQTAAAASGLPFLQFSYIAVALAAVAGFAFAWLGYRAKY